MVILDLDVCLDLDLEASRLFWLELVKVGKLKDWKIDRFDQG